MEPQEEVLKQTPALEAHEELGAKLTDFAGWSLPLRYPIGTTKEHLATREAVGVFDVSHLGRLVVTGKDALVLLQRAFTNDLGRIRPGRAQYTLLLNDQGGIVDDIIVCWEAAESFLVVPNAANTAAVLRALVSLRDEGGLETAVADVTSESAMIAVQGPLWKEVCIEAGFDELPERLGVLRSDDVLLAGTGYTGERGVEVVVPAARASKTFLDLARAAVERGGSPAGLAARDTLRLEMGYPLWGNEMDRSIAPYEAGLGWAVAEGKGDFVGRPMALDRKKRPLWDLVGVSMSEKGAIPRAGYTVSCRGVEGSVTSGGFSPLLSKGIALVRMPSGCVTKGDPVTVDIRGRPAEGVVRETPFVRTSLGR